eukprot:93587-Prymnesium_polylepis.1
MRSTAKLPVATGSTVSGRSAAVVNPRVARNWKMAAATRGGRRGWSPCNARTSWRTKDSALRCAHKCVGAGRSTTSQRMCEKREDGAFKWQSFLAFGLRLSRKAAKG